MMLCSAVLTAQNYFFEPSRNLVPGNARFPSVEHLGDKLVLVYQEVDWSEDEGGTIRLAVRTSENGRSWSDTRYPVEEAFRFTGTAVPLLYSLTVDESEVAWLAISSGATSTRILRSTDDLREFTELATIETDTTTVSPELFVGQTGGLILFVTQSVETSPSILYATSAGGERWSSLRRLETDPALALNFLPHHAAFGGKDIVVFQSLTTTGEATFQLYTKTSDDGGRSWTKAQLVTGFSDPQTGGESTRYDNQRPYIATFDSILAMVWERSYAGRQTRAFYAELDAEGSIKAPPEEVSSPLDSAHFPRLLQYDGRPHIFWFSNPLGNAQVTMAYRDDGIWRTERLATTAGVSTFSAITQADGRLHLFWQSRPDSEDPRTTSRIVYLEPDQSAPSPRPRGVDFVDRRRSNQERVSVTWNVPEDPSGIRGFNYVWSRDPEAPVPLELTHSITDERRVALSADEDGSWFFRVIARDFVGNWSEPATLEYIRDTTPPPPVEFVRPSTDEDGYLVSNTFTVRWKPPDDEIAGYSYTLRYLAPSTAPIQVSQREVSAPPPSIMTETPEISRTNFNNGLYMLTVSAIDSVGNVGEPSTIYLRMNKYIPVTIVSGIRVERDVLGRYDVDILGRGFTENGTIERIYIDADARPPYDYSFTREDYTVAGNRTIRNLLLQDLEEGTYRIGLVHAERGLYFARQSLEFLATGTVKFGDYSIEFDPHYTAERPRFFSLPMGATVFWTVMVFMATAAVFASRRIFALVQESQTLEREVRALIEGGVATEEEKRQRIEEMRKRGIGLRLKFTTFVVVLVIAVVVLVAFSLGSISLANQERILAEGLEQRAQVLLGSVAKGAEEYLPAPESNRLNLELLTRQTANIDEALYATITGRGQEGTTYDYVWATNDQAIIGEEATKIDTQEYAPGRSRITDGLSEVVPSIVEAVNRRAVDELGDRPQQVVDLNPRFVALAGRTDPDAQAERAQLDNIRFELEGQINDILSNIAEDFGGSIPEYDAENLDREQTDYVFYRPVLYRNQTEIDNIYYRGMARIGISTVNILAEISEARRSLIITTSFVALGAVAAGVIGALILATIVVIPINRLVQGVEVIRDTQDKAALDNHVIDVRTRDELNTLAETVNSMTQGLVRAAVANKDLVVGKEVQKMFIPLEQDSTGRKLTTGKEEEQDFEFFGYYEGAKGVSGDYYSYEKLDDAHYAIIKCDVAGKGVPAALIMVEVATIFLNYFKDWTLKTHGLRLQKLVETTNDLLEARGFKGRFAALTVTIINVKTGVCRVCNAGDNQIHVYESDARRVVQTTLPEAPAAGVFPSFLVPQGFKEVPMKLAVGDVMLLFTDGMEEAKRTFRDKSFRAHTVTAEDLESGRYPESVPEGSEDEEFGIPRIHAVIQAAQNRKKYYLEKIANPLGNEDLVFDFTTCEPSAETAVMALISVEKVFRLNPDPSAGPDDEIAVDRKVDAFLKEHFNQYRRYFSHPVDEESESEYVRYSHMKEDEQYDDLTLLAIRKK